jgi:predicted  nucleic acid-binding Zn-ribbon protein
MRARWDRSKVWSAFDESIGASMDNDSIQEAQENIAKLQSALDDAQQMLQAAERAQEAAQRAHEAAEAHAAELRTVCLVAIAVIVVAVLLGFRRRRS